MRDNDLLDGAWEAPEEPKPAPRAWQRSSCRDLDRVFGVVSGSHEDDDLFVPVRPPAPQPQSDPLVDAARKVQAVWRGFVTRRHVRALRA